MKHITHRKWTHATFHQLTRAALLSSASLLSLEAGAAQEDTKTKTQREDPALERIVVTAQRRVEDAQDVAVALTSLSGKELEDRGIKNINSLQYQVPNLEIDPQYGSGNPLFRIRGIGLKDYGTNNTSTVGVYIDEVAFPFPVQTQGLLFDLERVEVLRGPQGTLYGRNSTGGAINFITRKPTKTFESEIKASYGSYNSSNLQGFVSGPLTDTLRGRLSLSTEQGGAWQKNRDTGQKLGDKDLSAARGQLEWDANPDLTFNLSLTYGKDQSESRGARLYRGLVPGAAFGGGYSPIGAENDHRATGWSLTPAFAAATGLKVGQKPQRDNDSSGAALTTNWVLDEHLLLTSVTAYNSLKRREFIDWDSSVIPQSDEYFKTDIGVFSQELRLASVDNPFFNWVAGVYYSKEKLDEKFYSDFTANLGYATLTKYKQNAQTVSAFGQGTFALTDKLSLVAGLRQEHEERNLDNFSSGYLLYPTRPNLIGTTFFPESDRTLSTNELSAKLALEYRPAASHLLYASISRGVKSGGFTTYNSPKAEQIDPFKPEKLLAYEVGFKSDLSQALRVNGSLFFYDYRDQQYQSQVFINPIVRNVGRLTNIPKSQIWGAELELQWEPLRGLRIGQFAGYKEGKYIKFEGLDVAATRANGYTTPVYNDFAGNKLTNFPKISYGGSLAYTLDLDRFLVTAQTDYAFHDELTASDKALSTEAYWLANARLAVAPRGEKWEVALYARNVFDKKYDLYHGSFLSNAQIAHAGDPRTIGLETRYAF